MFVVDAVECYGYPNAKQEREQPARLWAPRHSTFHRPQAKRLIRYETTDAANKSAVESAGIFLN